MYRYNIEKVNIIEVVPNTNDKTLLTKFKLIKIITSIEIYHFQNCIIYFKTVMET